jgi:large subunit ribosomal protein L3
MDILIGKKLGMTQMFEESGRVQPVSVIQAGPCPIVQVKTVENDGYGAIQIGFGDVKESRMTGAVKGHFKKSGVAPLKVLREVRVDDPAKFKVGDALDMKLFEGAVIVNVIGRAKGRGFAGTIKRHHFQRGPETHGSKNVREPGSVGQNTTPGRIHKGKRLPGRLGGQRTTTRNLAVVQVDAENNLIFVKGAVPGPTNGFVLVKKVR